MKILSTSCNLGQAHSKSSYRFRLSAVIVETLRQLPASGHNIGHCRQKSKFPGRRSAEQFILLVVYVFSIHLISFTGMCWDLSY